MSLGRGTLPAFLALAILVRPGSASAKGQPITWTPNAVDHPPSINLNLEWSVNVGLGPNNDVFASDRSRFAYSSAVMDVTIGRRWRRLFFGGELQGALAFPGPESFFAGAVVGPRFSWRQFSFGADAALGGRIMGFVLAENEQNNGWLLSSQLAAHVAVRYGTARIGLWGAFRQDLSFRTVILQESSSPVTMPVTIDGQVAAHLGGYSRFLGLRFEL